MDNKIKFKYFIKGVFFTIILIGLIFLFYKFIINPNNKAIDKNNNQKNNNQLEKNTDNIEDISMKRIDIYSKDKLEYALNYKLEPTKINSIYEDLSNSIVWKNLYYSDNDAQIIADKFKENTDQSFEILKNIIHSNKNLKLTLIPIDSKLQVNIDIDDNISNLDSNNDYDISLEDIDIKNLNIIIKYNNKKINLTYILDNNTIKAIYLNEITDEILKGKSAINFLKGNVLKLNYSNNQNQIINDVLNSLNLDHNFNNFDLSVELLNHNKIEFSISK